MRRSSPPSGGRARRPSPPSGPARGSRGRDGRDRGGEASSPPRGSGRRRPSPRGSARDGRRDDGDGAASGPEENGDDGDDGFALRGTRIKIKQGKNAGRTGTITERIKYEHVRLEGIPGQFFRVGDDVEMVRYGDRRASDFETRHMGGTARVIRDGHPDRGTVAKVVKTVYGWWYITDNRNISIAYPPEKFDILSARTALFKRRRRAPDSDDETDSDASRGGDGPPPKRTTRSRSGGASAADAVTTSIRSTTTPGKVRLDARYGGTKVYLASVPRDHARAAERAARSAGDAARSEGLGRESAAARMRDAARAAVEAARAREERRRARYGSSSEDDDEDGDASAPSDEDYVESGGEEDPSEAGGEDYSAGEEEGEDTPNEAERAEGSDGDSDSEDGGPSAANPPPLPAVGPPSASVRAPSSAASFDCFAGALVHVTSGPHTGLTGRLLSHAGRGRWNISGLGGRIASSDLCFVRDDGTDFYAIHEHYESRGRLDRMPPIRDMSELDGRGRGRGRSRGRPRKKSKDSSSGGDDGEEKDDDSEDDEASPSVRRSPSSATDPGPLMGALVHVLRGALAGTTARITGLAGGGYYTLGDNGNVRSCNLCLLRDGGTADLDGIREYCARQRRIMPPVFDSAEDAEGGGRRTRR